MVGYSNSFFYFMKGYIIFVLIYLVLFLIGGKLFDLFELGETTTTDLFLSFSLTSMFSGAFVYLILCLYTIKLINIIPVLLMIVADMIVGAVILLMENRYIRSVYPPVRVVAIYGEEHHGLIGKLNNVKDLSISVIKTISLEDIDYSKLDELIGDADGVVTLDVHHENKKKIFKSNPKIKKSSLLINITSLS